MGRDIPVLDLGDFDGAPARRFVDALREAVHEIGFFQLVGHGVPDDLLAERAARSPPSSSPSTTTTATRSTT